MCHILNPDVFVIREYWLKEFIGKTEIIDTSYQIYRQDIKNKGGRRVLILVKSEYFSEERTELVTQSTVANEILAVEIKNTNGQWLLVIVDY